MGYEEVHDKMAENDLSWDEIDRILLNEEKYEEFQSRSSSNRQANYETNDAPAVRRTEKREMIVYVNEYGYTVQIEL